jgi:iron-sulfur cluster assembly protein
LTSGDGSLSGSTRFEVTGKQSFDNFDSSLTITNLSDIVNSLAQSIPGMSTTAETEKSEIEVSDAASEKALALLEQESLDPDTAGLRLFVQQGGCAGLSYGMRFDTSPEEDDLVYEHDGLRVFVDPASMQYIAGSVVAYETGLQGEGFDVENPNVVSECGCGESFRT